MEKNKYLTVAALNKYIAYKVETDINLKNFVILGEISNARVSKGHLYFVLKDEESEISAIMFANYYSALPFTPNDGDKVLVKCSVQLYQKKGTYSLLATNMALYGLGDLYQNFLKLKEKLSKEGLFDRIYKKPIPEYAEAIGLITSSTGDAMHDVISTINKRFPIAKVFLYPALVQGEEAPKSLIKAIRKAEIDNDVELLIIARGGGSIEDLSCFNDEELARVIFDCNIPIISGVGHESDFTICDFVSDERAPTPTGAAVLATKDKNVILSDVSSSMTKIIHFTKKVLEKKFYDFSFIINNHYFKNFSETILKKEEKVENLTKILHMNSPMSKIEFNENNLSFLVERLKKYNINEKICIKETEIDFLNNKLNDLLLTSIKENNNLVDGMIDKLILLNPLNLMKKGYSLTYQDDKLISSFNDLDETKNITTRFYDGVVESKIIRKEKV